MTDTPQQAARHMSMRTQNQALLLRLIRHEGPITKAQLAARTGLAKSGITNIIEDFFAAKIITETASTSDNTRGRPGFPLTLSPESPAALGLEINVDYISAISATLTGDIIETATTPLHDRTITPREAVELGEPLLRQCSQAARDQNRSIAGCTVAIPGTVNPHTNLIQHAPNLGWHNLDVTQTLHDAFAPYNLPIPTRLENEANCAALAERWYGASSANDNYLYISGEIGIGSGIIVDGKLFRGSGGFAGEFGHVIVNPDGPLCRCGSYGCLEGYAGFENMLAHAGIPADIDDPIAALAAAPATLDLAAKYLAIGIASATTMIDQSAIILGGHLSQLGEQITPYVQKHLERYAPNAPSHQKDIITSELGRNAAVRGAAGLVSESIFENPTHYLTLVL